MYDTASAGSAIRPVSLSAGGPNFDRQRLLAGLAERLAGARPHGDVYSISLALPEVTRVGAPPHLPDLWSWSRPSEDLNLVGCGSALRREYADPAALADAVRRLSWIHDDPDGLGDQPVAFLGHGFGGDDPAGLPPALLRVPRLLLRHLSGRSDLTFSHAGEGSFETVLASWLEAADQLLLALSTPMPALTENPLIRVDERPGADVFEARVRAVTAAIAAGRVEKVVLSRRVVVAGSRPFVPARLAAALTERHPSCAIITAAFGARTLVAASPERLVAGCDGLVESYALAGTARCNSDEPFLGGRLLCSAKDLHEHQLVVRWIVEALRGVCDDLDVPAEPRRMVLGQLQHLWTPIAGTLRADADLLQAAYRLHPTPAVAGLPLAAARDLLAELGESRSGWYTGAMGWIDRSGDGELAVVLRCALLNGYLAELSAGGGIVAASQPEAEFAETELKLQTMLEALRVA